MHIGQAFLCVQIGIYAYFCDILIKKLNCTPKMHNQKDPFGCSESIGKRKAAICVQKSIKQVNKWYVNCS